ncbi:MAG: hypothetical protein J6Q28_06455 [Alistipes sp.]|nr:hypothetical protein [Alistipes sp.]
MPSVGSSSAALSIAVTSARHGVLPLVDSGGIKAEAFVESLRIGTLPLVTSGIICEIIGRKNLLLRDKSLRLLRTRSGKLLYVVK